MRSNKINTSIIIVNYKTEKEVINCLESIQKKIKNLTFEVIVVENEEGENISQSLQKFKFVKYIKALKNLGFGAGNNLGAKNAKGEYLLFLNPDTIIVDDAIDKLVEFINQDDKIAIVSPLLLDKEQKVSKLQGTCALTPIRGIFALSFINKYFPNNPISRNYYNLDWDKTKDLDVDVIPGSAFLIRKSVFEKVGRFDEKLFLYFEESDLCKRVKEKGYKIFITVNAKVIHLWGRSTKNLSNTKEIFEQSKYYYFQKHYGKFWAFIVRLITTKR